MESKIWCDFRAVSDGTKCDTFSSVQISISCVHFQNGHLKRFHHEKKRKGMNKDKEPFKPFWHRICLIEKVKRFYQKSLKGERDRLRKKRVYRPKAVIETENTEKAPRLQSFEGVRIAFLDNLKPQSDQVLQGIQEYFQQQNVETEMFKKIDTPIEVPQEVVQQIRQSFHAVITGVGD